MVGKKAALFPGFSAVYSSLAYLSMSYKTQTYILNLSPFRLYPIPFPPSAPLYSPITSKFADISEAFLPADSTIKFSDNSYGLYGDPISKFTYGDIMFSEFDQGQRSYRVVQQTALPNIDFKLDIILYFLI